jgi:ketosteroid isomerase-like protein
MKEPKSGAGQLITRLYQALGEGRLDDVTSLLAPDVVLHVPGGYVGAGDFVGLDAVTAAMAAPGATTDDGDHIELLDVLEGVEHVAAYCRVRATRQGRTALDNHTVHLARTAGGVISEIWFHNRDQAAVDAFRS